VYDVLGRDEGDPLEKEVLGLDVTMNDAALLVEVPNTVSDLEDDMTGECFGKVRQFDAWEESVWTRMTQRSIRTSDGRARRPPGLAYALGCCSKSGYNATYAPGQGSSVRQTRRTR
jgi:hypothetical protein